jgi:hypothetical protein
LSGSILKVRHYPRTNPVAVFSFSAEVIRIAQISFAPLSILAVIQRNQDHMSMNFERWKHLSALASRERDPEKLTDLARELNIVLNEKTQTPDSRPLKASE